jgi:hypothetical protein
MCLGMPLVPLEVPGLDLVDQCGLRRDTAPEALTTEMAEFDLRHVEPTAMFGGIMDVSFLGDSFGLSGVKCFIQRGFGVGIQLVHHETEFLYVRRMLINQVLDKVRPINFRSLLRDFCHTVPG